MKLHLCTVCSNLKVCNGSIVETWLTYYLHENSHKNQRSNKYKSYSSITPLCIKTLFSIPFIKRFKVNFSWCIGILIVVRYFVGSPLSGERTKSSHVVPLPFQMIINGGTELPAIDSTEMNDTTPQGSIWILTGRIQKSYPPFDVARKKVFHWHIEGNTKCWYRAMWGLKYIKLQTSCASSLNYCILHLLSTAFESVLYLFYKKSQYTVCWSELAAQLTTPSNCQDMGKNYSYLTSGIMPKCL